MRFTEVRPDQLASVQGGLFGPFDVILAPLMDWSRNESACDSARRARDDYRKYNDLPSKAWYESKRQECNALWL